MKSRAKFIAGALTVASAVGLNFAVEFLASRKAEKVMVCAVGRAWQCPADSIKVTALGQNSYFFTGCGHQSTYRCKLPSEGCLTKGGADPLPVRECE